MTITRLKIYRMACDGSVDVKDGDGHYREDCPSVVEVRAVSKSEALRQLPEDWKCSMGAYYLDIRCPKEHLY